MQAVTVDEDGYVTVSQDHYSDYVLTKEKIASGSDEEESSKDDISKDDDASKDDSTKNDGETKGNTDVTKKNDEETTVKSDNPKTGDAATAFPVIVLIGSAMTIAAGMKKVKRAE